MPDALLMRSCGQERRGREGEPVAWATQDLHRNAQALSHGEDTPSSYNVVDSMDHTSKSICRLSPTLAGPNASHLPASTRLIKLGSPQSRQGPDLPQIACTVSFDGDALKPFRIITGIKQGCVLLWLSLASPSLSS